MTPVALYQLLISPLRLVLDADCGGMDVVPEIAVPRILLLIRRVIVSNSSVNLFIVYNS